MTFFQSVPATGEAIVLLCNSQRSWPLFSSVLSDWSRWIGIPPVGMSLIGQVAQFLRIFLFLFYPAILIGFLRTAMSFIRKRRRFIFENPVFRGDQAVQATVSVCLVSVVIGISRMEYFFLNSFFPVETPWRGWGVVFLAGLLLLLSITPKAKNSAKEDRRTNNKDGASSAHHQR